MKDSAIYIIGSGAIGKSIAVFLQQDNKKVVLVRGSVDHKSEKEIMIRVVNQDNQEFHQNITTTTFSNLDSIHGIVLITVKTHANAAIAKKLMKVKGVFSITLLQYGLNIERPFESFDEVYRSVIFSTSQVINGNTVRFKAVSDSPIGTIKGNRSKLDSTIKQIHTPYFGFRSEPNISKYVWNKVVINCAFNAICPLLEVDNGVFHRNSDATRLAKTIISECVALAEKYNVGLDQTEIEEKLIQISRRADGQLISTYEDIRNRRKTEIESLNLEIARLADEIGMPELVANTKLLGEMIQIKSEIKFR